MVKIKLLDNDLLKCVNKKPVGLKSTCKESQYKYMCISNNEVILKPEKSYSTHWLFTLIEKPAKYSQKNNISFRIQNENGEYMCYKDKYTNAHDPVIYLNQKLDEITKNECIWYLGKKGTIYTMSSNKELYLWVANDKVYLTPDGFLAESWTIDPILNINRPLQNNPPDNLLTENIFKMYALLGVLSLICILFIYSRK